MRRYSYSMLQNTVKHKLCDGPCTREWHTLNWCWCWSSVHYHLHALPGIFQTLHNAMYVLLPALGALTNHIYLFFLNPYLYIVYATWGLSLDIKANFNLGKIWSWFGVSTEILNLHQIFPAYMFPPGSIWVECLPTCPLYLPLWNIRVLQPLPHQRPMLRLFRIQ